MEDSNKFLGMDKGNLPVLGLLLTILVVVISLFNMQNAAINRLGDEMAALRSEMREDNATLRSELKDDIRALSDDLDALENEMDALENEMGAVGSDLNALKLDTAEIKVRIAEIERRMLPLESVNGRLDELEREQAQLKERVDALSSVISE